MVGTAIHKPAGKWPHVLQFTEDLVDKGAYEQWAAMAEPDVAGGTFAPIGCLHDEQAVEQTAFRQIVRWHKNILTHNTSRYRPQERVASGGQNE